MLAIPQGAKLGGGLRKLELCQLRRGLRQGLLRLLLHEHDALLLANKLVVARQPLKISLLVLLLSQQGFLFVSKCLQTLL